MPKSDLSATGQGDLDTVVPTIGIRRLPNGSTRSSSGWMLIFTFPASWSDQSRIGCPFSNRVIFIRDWPIRLARSACVSSAASRKPAAPPPTAADAHTD